MNKEETIFRKHLIDLSRKAYQRDIAVFSDFLNLNEIHILKSTPKASFDTGYRTFGGYEYAERQMVAFLPDALSYEINYPISVIRIIPDAPKFADKLTHRDYLGSVLNLGIDRSKIGDLITCGQECILFTHSSLADYLKDEIRRVKHTNVHAGIIPAGEFSYKPSFTEMKGTVASVRLDSVLSISFPLSRSKLTGYIEGGKVFVNGKLITSNGYHLKEDDIITVRGMGRIQFREVLSETRKGRYFVRIYKF